MNDDRGEYKVRASYPNPEIRGRMRLWKTEALEKYHAIERLIPDLEAVGMELFRKASTSGRQRIFERLRKRVGDAATLEGVRLEGRHPLIVWAALRPGFSALVDHEDPAMGQDGVTVQYLLVGQFGDYVGTALGLWTLEVPDHALGRIMERRPDLTPEAIIYTAHHNLLRIRHAQVFPGSRVPKEFRVRCGPGGFACNFINGTDKTGANIFIRPRTWLDDDQLRAEQVLLADDGEPGHRLCDGFLVPQPMRRMVRLPDGRLDAEVWRPGMPQDMMARPVGRA